MIVALLALAAGQIALAGALLVLNRRITHLRADLAVVDAAQRAAGALAHRALDGRHAGVTLDAMPGAAS